MNVPDWTGDYRALRDFALQALRVLIRELGDAAEIKQLEALTAKAQGTLGGFYLVGVVSDHERAEFDALINEANWARWEKLATA